MLKNKFSVKFQNLTNKNDSKFKSSLTNFDSFKMIDFEILLFKKILDAYKILIFTMLYLKNYFSEIQSPKKGKL